MKKRKAKNLAVWALFTIIVGVVAIFMLSVYFRANMDRYVSVKETSDLDYKVYLKENEYFKSKYLGKNNKYIANIIDYIDTDYVYTLTFPEEKDVEYNYLYKVMAELKVNDKDDDVTYYEYAEEIYSSGKQKSKGSIDIKQNLKIDYNKYNDLISDFVDDFDLDRSESTLNVTMYVMMLDNENDYVKSLEENNKVISLSIPLTTKSLSISMSSDLSNNTSKILVKQEGKKLEFLIIGTIWSVIALSMAIYVVIYYVKNRTPHAIYRKKVKSILNNYGSYIQEIDNSHKIGASVVYKLKSFDDLLEVKDTIQKPILMIRNSKDTGAFFIIPANEFTIYSYAIRVVDIVASKKGLETPDYDVNNLSKETIEEKKFTKQYIDSQIDDATRTITMNKLDADNVILGNKNSKESIYEQLEKTRSYKISDIKEAAKKAEKEKTVKVNKVKIEDKKEKTKKEEKPKKEKKNTKNK